MRLQLIEVSGGLEQYSSNMNEANCSLKYYTWWITFTSPKYSLFILPDPSKLKENLNPQQYITHKSMKEMKI